MKSYYGEEGCCLTCEEAEEGCLCPECACSECEHYVSYEYEEGGYCNIAREFKIKKENWEKFLEKMKKEGRILVFCPNCKKNKFMDYFGEKDELANYYCHSCQTYWTTKTLREMKWGK